VALNLPSLSGIPFRVGRRSELSPKEISFYIDGIKVKYIYLD